MLSRTVRLADERVQRAGQAHANGQSTAVLHPGSGTVATDMGTIRSKIPGHPTKDPSQPIQEIHPRID